MIQKFKEADFYDLRDDEMFPLGRIWRLGVGNMDKKNRALLAKWLWKFFPERFPLWSYKKHILHSIQCKEFKRNWKMDLIEVLGKPILSNILHSTFIYFIGEKWQGNLFMGGYMAWRLSLNQCYPILSSFNVNKWVTFHASLDSSSHKEGET